MMDDEEILDESDFIVLGSFTTRMREKEAGADNTATSRVEMNKQSGLKVGYYEKELRFKIGDSGAKFEIAPETGLTAKEIGEWFIKQHKKKREYHRLCAEYERKYDSMVEKGDMTFEEYAENYPDAKDVWGEE